MKYTTKNPKDLLTEVTKVKDCSFIEVPTVHVNMLYFPLSLSPFAVLRTRIASLEEELKGF